MPKKNEPLVDPRGADNFPDQWKDPFEGLLYLGYLNKEVTRIPNHHFVVRTLTVNEKLQINLATKEYQDTFGFGRAYRAAVVAAGLESVDGQELIAGAKGINVFQQKFEFVINSWYDGVIDVLYEAIDELEGNSLKVLQEIGILPANAETTPIFKDGEQSGDDPKGGK